MRKSIGILCSKGVISLGVTKEPMAGYNETIVWNAKYNGKALMRELAERIRGRESSGRK